MGKRTLLDYMLGTNAVGFVVIRQGNEILCQSYENAKIRNENEFKEMLDYVLSDTEKI